MWTLDKKAHKIGIDYIRGFILKPIGDGLALQVHILVNIYFYSRCGVTILTITIESELINNMLISDYSSKESSEISSLILSFTKNETNHRTEAKEKSS